MSPTPPAGSRAKKQMEKAQREHCRSEKIMASNEELAALKTQVEAINVTGVGVAWVGG